MQRRREDAAKQELVARANITRARVLAAIGRVELDEFKAKDVAIALIPEVADSTLPGRQAVINLVGMQMRRLVKDGRLVDRIGGDELSHHYRVLRDG